MNAYSQAQTAYAQASAPTRTDRGTEYAIFARVTKELKSVDESDKSQFPRLAHAVQTNHRLWNTLAADLMQDENSLPVALRGQILSLALFVGRQTHAILSGKASKELLVEINTAIMKGLRSGGQAA